MTLLAQSPRGSGRTDLRVRVVDPITEAGWAPFVAGHPAATVYHDPLWLTVVQAAYGHRPFGLLVEDGAGRVRGVLPLMRSQGLLTGPRWTSLPHTPYCGLLAADAPAARALITVASDAAARRRATLLLKAAPGGPEEGGDGWRRCDDTFVLDLPERPELLRLGNARNHARLRWAVSKAERCGVRVREASSEDDLRRWYPLYLQTMRHHAVPPRPISFFLAMWRLLYPAGRMRLLLAEQQHAGGTALLAGSVALAGGTTVSYAFNGRRPESLALRPNDLIQWRAIHQACAEGYRRYDFGEVDRANRGLADFKRKWGARPVTLYRLTVPALPAADLPSPGVVEAGRRTAGRLWRRLPLPVTDLAGRLIYRYA